MSPGVALSDAHLLAILEARALGATVDDIALRMGLTRSAVAGHIFRMAPGRVPDHCRRPENRDGGMPPGWWRAGLARQAERGRA